MAAIAAANRVRRHRRGNAGKPAAGPNSLRHGCAAARERRNGEATHSDTRLPEPSQAVPLKEHSGVGTPAAAADHPEAAAGAHVCKPCAYRSPSALHVAASSAGPHVNAPPQGAACAARQAASTARRMRGACAPRAAAHSVARAGQAASEAVHRRPYRPRPKREPLGRAWLCRAGGTVFWSDRASVEADKHRGTERTAEDVAARGGLRWCAMPACHALYGGRRPRGRVILSSVAPHRRCRRHHRHRAEAARG